MLSHAALHTLNCNYQAAPSCAGLAGDGNFMPCGSFCPRIGKPLPVN